MSVPELAIVAKIGREMFPRADVLAWEDERIDAAAGKVGVGAPAPAPIAERREAWLHTKQELGSDELLRRLGRDTTIADAMGRLAKISGRRRRSVTELFVPGGSAHQFTEWFTAITIASDEAALLRACPDHFVLRMYNGTQQVLETNGGSPFAALFDIDYDDVSSLTTPVDVQFPDRLDGVARGSDGTAIGGVRHQFRDTSDGVHARVLVEFPLTVPGSVVRGHRWHLACEFSNWFEAAIADAA
ncbi:hypothetical protein GYA93_06315 [Gordonia desulfuricans]|uniref:Uncharacterized protein n=2 Tax=Gordonia desulfuricans TaxID=89051 RepID=A0A7K3LLU5_9ACTN|nr:hypothetical protein [Gordonia desulfuricans]